MMVSAGSYRQYRQVQVTTSGRGTLVVMLYNGAIRSLRLATELMRDGEMGKKGDQIIKAQEMIMELNLALDLTRGGDIARNLRKIYLYLYRTLSEANFRKSTAGIEEAIRLLSTLRDAWQSVASGKAETGDLHSSPQSAQLVA